uniref:Transposable element Tc3 transposase-like DNA-binding HTH domain-containing protein n=1 Tax=Caenorhabditis japonica TaxID=281687 RepID=A0A8R1E4N0_CAEJA
MVILDVFANDLGKGDRVDVNDNLFGDIVLITSFMALPNSRLADIVSTFDNIHRTESHRFLAVKEFYLLKSVSTTTHAVHASKHIPRNDIKPLGWKQLEAGDLRGVPGTTISQVDTSHSFPLFAQFTFYRSTVYPFQLLPLTNIIIRVVSNSPKNLYDVRAELNLSVCKQTVYNAITRSGTIVRHNITRNHMKRRSQLVHHETLCLLSNSVEWSSAHDEIIKK